MSHCVVTVQGLTGSQYSGRWKNIHKAVGMSDMALFTGGWPTHAASCMSLCMSLCGILHVACCLACHMSWQPAGSPYLLKYQRQTNLAGCQQILCHRASYYACGHTQGYGYSLLDPVSRLWEHYLPGPFSRLWETGSLSYPDTWVRKPDCLHLPYTNPKYMQPHCPLYHIRSSALGLPVKVVA